MPLSQREKGPISTQNVRVKDVFGIEAVFDGLHDAHFRPAGPTDQRRSRRRRPGFQHDQLAPAAEAARRRATSTEALSVVAPLGTEVLASVVSALFQLDANHAVAAWAWIAQVG